MAMDGDTLGLAIKAAVQGAAASNPSDSDGMFKAMGNAIVGHIQANGVLSITITQIDGDPANVSGETVPGGLPVTGVAIGTGTIT